jgi:hypothetical protein
MDSRQAYNNLLVTIKEREKILANKRQLYMLKEDFARKLLQYNHEKMKLLEECKANLDAIQIQEYEI